MCDESIKPPTTSDNSIAPALSCFGNKARVKFDGICLKQDKFIFPHEKTVIIYCLWKKNCAMMIAQHQKILCWCS